MSGDPARGCAQTWFLDDQGRGKRISDNAPGMHPFLGRAKTLSRPMESRPPRTGTGAAPPNASG